MIDVLMAWHVDAEYVLQWKGLAESLKTSRGVRQGCRGAPFFWSCFIVLIFQTIARQTNPGWVRPHCAFYADDGPARITFHDKNSF